MSFSLLSCFTCAESEMDNGAIKSPDGFYMVGPLAVYQIKATEPPSNGSYKVNGYIVERASTFSTYYKYTEYSKHFKIDEHIESGWWAPNSQQFYVEKLGKSSKVKNCSSWTDPVWSFSFIPTTFSLNGREVTAWKETNNYSNDRVPKGLCDKMTTYRDTCMFPVRSYETI